MTIVCSYNKGVVLALSIGSDAGNVGGIGGLHNAVSAPVSINNDTVASNFTYHQVTGVSIVIFSVGLGGIHHAAEQSLDYMTSPQSGIVVPNEGYRFAD